MRLWWALAGKMPSTTGSCLTSRRRYRTLRHINRTTNNDRIKVACWICVYPMSSFLFLVEEREREEERSEKKSHAPNSYFNHMLIQCISWPDKLQSLVTDVHLLDPVRVRAVRIVGLFPLSNNAVITLVNARELFKRINKHVRRHC